MRTFNYSLIREQKWDSELLGYVAAIHKEAGKQELYLKQRPEELEKLVAYKNGNEMEKTLYDYYVPSYIRVLGSFQIHIDR